MDAKKMCRVCLCEAHDLTPLRVKLPDAKITYEETINFVANISILLEDGIPDKICKICETALHSAYTFKQRCLESEAIVEQTYKQKCTDDTQTLTENKNQKNADTHSKDNLPAAISNLFKETTETGVNVYDIPEYKIEIEIVEEHISHEFTASEQGNLLDKKDDFETISTKSKEQFPIYEECFKNYYSHEDETTKGSTRNSNNKVKLSELKTGAYNTQSFSGDACDKKYKQKGNLINHKTIHTGDKPYACNILLCKKNFMLKSSLIRHLNTHTYDKRFACDVCDQKFNRKDGLVTHKRIHTGDKPYSCDVCDQKFNQKCHLIDHKRIHTDVKPFSCDVCKKKFTQKSTLVRHLKTHTKDKLFSCDVCDQKFKRKDNLVTHNRIHIGDKPFSCHVCDLKFNQKAHLNGHKRIHTKGKPFSCNICKKKFSKKSNLVRHLYTHTNDKPFPCENTISLHIKEYTGDAAE